MAATVASASWEADGVKLGQVVAALTELRRRAGDRSAIRTSVMTVVAVAAGDASAEEARATLRSLGGQHPARIVLLRPDPDSVPALDARLRLYSTTASSHRVNFEEVALAVGGQAARHLDSLVEAFALPDLPLALWYVDSIPSPGDPLLELATAVVVDSRDLDAGELSGLADVLRHHVVLDLSWARLRPWRELLAGLFDPPAYRPYLRGVTGAVVKGKPGPRRLLGAWLAAQLRLRPDQLRLADARHVELTVSSNLDNEEGTFEEGTFDVGRLPGQRAVWAGATVTTAPSVRQVLPLPDDPLVTCLSAVLTRMERDPVWERAVTLAAALAMSDSG